jgi:hypothetical protein
MEVPMSDGEGGGSRLVGALGFVGILVVVNGLSWLFDWSFWLY